MNCLAELVSVVVPIYNVERYIDRCLKSITEQTYKNLQIILVDDGSLDNCPKICDAWAKKDSRIKVIHKQNQGLGLARKSGYEASEGKYIFFFDSDDYVAKNLVERCVTTAKEYDVDTVLYGRNDVYPNGEIRPGRKITEKIFEGKDIKELLLPGLFDYGFGCGVSQWSKMFSTDIIRKNAIRFESEREVTSEDAMFCLEYFSKSSSAAIIPENLYYYQKNNSSLTQTFRADRGMKNNEFLLKALKRVDELKLSNKVAQGIITRYHGMTLGALKQIVCADISEKDKKQMTYKIFNDDVLRETLKCSVISHNTFFKKMFWWCLKFKGYSLCYFLINLKAGM